MLIGVALQDQVGPVFPDTKTQQLWIILREEEHRFENVCIWSDMPDAMLVKTHAFKLQIRDKNCKSMIKFVLV